MHDDWSKSYVTDKILKNQRKMSQIPSFKYTVSTFSNLDKKKYIMHYDRYFWKENNL